MNRTGIEWVRNPDGTQGYTWNPVVGCTGLNCAVVKECYARRTAKRFKQRCQQCYEFKPHLHPERLNQPYSRKPRGIFVCSMGDLFDDNLAERDLIKVLQEIEQTPRNRYYILTKQPENMVRWVTHRDFIVRYHFEECWMGVTVNRKCDLHRIDYLREVKAQVRFVSFEPLMEDLGSVNLESVNWIIIGAQTKPEKQPSEYWVNYLILKAVELGIPIFLKNNLKPIREGPFIGGTTEYNFKAWQQFPKV